MSPLASMSGLEAHYLPSPTRGSANPKLPVDASNPHNMRKIVLVTICVCASGAAEQDCCGPFLDGELAPTAEKLMRSRYVAYAQGNIEHLLRTWHRTTCPPRWEPDQDTQWYRLDVVAVSGGSHLDQHGTVEFRAFWRSESARGVHHEVSRFLREKGAWYYVDGTL